MGQAAKLERTPRERLIDSIIDLIGEVGFEAASVRDIAARAGTSFGLIRILFGSKEALRDAAEELVFSHYSAMIDGAIAASSYSDIARFLAESEADIEELNRHIRFIRRCLVEDRPVATDLVRRMLAAYREQLRPYAERYPDEAWLRNPTRAVAGVLGAFLIAPQIREISGVNLFSVVSATQGNAELGRVWQILEAGLAAVYGENSG